MQEQENRLAIANLRPRAGHDHGSPAGPHEPVQQRHACHVPAAWHPVSPIADLMKTEVFALARHLGVVESILDAKPTDGLWDFIRQRCDMPKINLMGICMGGSFCVMYSALHPQKIKNLVTTVSPTNFDTDQGLLHIWSQPKLYPLSTL